MPEFQNITLAILAGGKATRMNGKNKALIKFEGQTFISRVHQNLSPLFKNAMIISNDYKDFNIPKTSVYPDIIENIGPLGGIHSALVNSSTPFIFIVSCDLPFADATIARLIAKEFLLQKPDILLPTISSFNEPLFAIYSKRIYEKISLMVSTSNRRAITDLLKISNSTYIDLPDNQIVKRCFININTEDDLKRLWSMDLP